MHSPLRLAALATTASSRTPHMLLALALLAGCGDKEGGDDDGTVGGDTGSSSDDGSSDDGATDDGIGSDDGVGDSGSGTDDGDSGGGDGGTDSGSGPVDADGDGFTADEDCDDTDSMVNPDAPERCNGVDDDCNGAVDDDPVDGDTWYLDDDGDGYGDGDATTQACDQPAGYVADDSDCNDKDDDVYPGAPETCDDADEDCDGVADNDAVDATTWFEDADGDGYGAATGARKDSCDEPRGYTDNTDDCDDSDADVNPGATEVCNDLDDDCDGAVDGAAAIDAAYLYEDNDGDGFGDESTYDLMCDGVEIGWDCDDRDATEPQAVDASASAGSATGSLSRPWTTIQEGIDNADECVVVFGGTYSEAIDFGGQEVLVTGVEGAESTTIDASGTDAPAVTFEGGERSAAELVGFTITGGEGYEETSSSSYSCGSSTTCTDYYYTRCGGGIYIDGSTPTLSGLTLTDNDLTMPADSESGDDTYTYMSFGGGLCLRNATLSIDDVDFVSNYADDGGAVYVESDGALSLSSSWIIGNTAESGGGATSDGGTLRLTNAIVAFNESDDGGGVYANDGTLVITNASFAYNDAENGGGIYLDGSAGATLLNSIVFASETGDGVLVGSSASIDATYSNVYGSTGDEYSGVTDPSGSDGNISSNPRFTSATDNGDLTDDDFSLTSTSPSVDAGNPSSTYDDADGTTNDQGAYGGSGSEWE